MGLKMQNATLFFLKCQFKVQVYLSLISKDQKHEICLSTVSSIGPDKDTLCTLNCIYFLTHQFEHVFCVLKRTVSLRRFF